MPEFLYQDTPDNVTGSFIVGRMYAQPFSNDVAIFNGVMPAAYKNWATFERGGFKLEKTRTSTNPKNLFNYGADQQIVFTSREVSDENGSLGVEEQDQGETVVYYPSIVFYPPEGVTYSGSGFSLKTFMDFYDISIVVQDESGNRVKHFVRDDTHNTDEFFVFPFNGLKLVDIYFKHIRPFNFVKVYGIGLGATRTIDNSRISENPLLVTHFSPTNEELEIDTLSMTIFGSREEYNFVYGEKLIDTQNNKDFYISDVKYNDKGTIDIEAYDRLMLLEESDYSGMMRKNSTILTDNLLKKGLYEFDARLLTEYDGATYSGTISNEETVREALRVFLQGCGICMRREGNTFHYFLPQFEQAVTIHKSEICSPVDIEKLDRVQSVKFSRHNYVIDRSNNNKSEAFRDNVPRNEETTISYGAPYTSQVVYYDDNGTLREVSQSEIIASGAYFRTLRNTHTQEIVVMGYPYKTNYSYIKAQISDSNGFRTNNINISDCTICNDDRTAVADFLSETYDYIWIITFDSIVNVGAGKRVEVYYDDNENGNPLYIEGFVVEKRDEYTGVYNYTVVCYARD